MRGSAGHNFHRNSAEGSRSINIRDFPISKELPHGWKINFTNSGFTSYQLSTIAIIANVCFRAAKAICQTLQKINKVIKTY